MAKAKKCRHCGEWLEQPAEQAEQPIQQATDGETGTEDGELFAPPCTSGITATLLILAVISEFLLLVHDDWMTIAVEGNRAFGLGKWRTVDEIFKAMLQVPEWLCSVVNIIAMLSLLVLFLKGMKRMSRPFTSLTGCVIGLFAFTWVLSFVMDIMATESSSITEEAACVLFIFVLLVAIATTVLQIILGAKLIRFYDGAIWVVGLLLILIGGLDFVSVLIYALSDNPFGLMPIIASCLNTGLYILLYFQLASLLGASSRIKDELIYAVGLLVAGVLVYGIIAYNKYGDTEKNGIEDVEKSDGGQNSDNYEQEYEPANDKNEGYYSDDDYYSQTSRIATVNEALQRRMKYSIA